MDETVDAGIESDGGAAVDTVVDSTSSDGSNKDNTDWKALLDAEKARADKMEQERNNYKTALSQKREFVKNGVNEAVEDDKPLTRSELGKVLREEITPIIAQNKVDLELEKQVPDAEKRKLVKLYYETRVRQMGTSDDAIRNDISAALAIADAQKLRKAATEIKRKTDMQTSPPLNGSQSEPTPVTKNHKFSPAQVQALTEKAKRLGMDPTKFLEATWKNQNRG